MVSHSCHLKKLANHPKERGYKWRASITSEAYKGFSATFKQGFSMLQDIARSKFNNPIPFRFSDSLFHFIFVLVIPNIMLGGNN